ncbi:hypothetical protein AC739_19240, partial [Planococcus glaciei]|uniref:hypothetical protein n=1 Tax=Planococcus glaciei TaxID=459472 RepID=UPI0006C60AA9
KQEYEEILIEKFGKLPTVKPVQYFKTSLQDFKMINIEEAQLLVFNQLRKRVSYEEVKLIKELPLPLRWTIYNASFSRKEILNILEKIK